ncbi:MAG: hypothetical protein Q3998_07720, partial [Porphyromonas sp.]|nr:hypothetical protein [Porphyromonas sp.]
EEVIRGKRKYLKTSRRSLSECLFIEQSGIKNFCPSFTGDNREGFEVQESAFDSFHGVVS